MVSSYTFNEGNLLTPFVMQTRGAEMMSTEGNIRLSHHLRAIGSHMGVGIQDINTFPKADDVDQLLTTGQVFAQQRYSDINRLCRAERPDQLIPAILANQNGMSTVATQMHQMYGLGADGTQEGGVKIAYSAADKPYFLWWAEAPLHSPVKIEESEMILATQLARFLQADFVVNRKYDHNGRLAASTFTATGQTRFTERIAVLMEKWRKLESELITKGPDSIFDPASIPSIAFQRLMYMYNSNDFAKGKAFSIDLCNRTSLLNMRIMAQTILDIEPILKYVVDFSLNGSIDNMDGVHLVADFNALKMALSGIAFDSIGWQPLPEEYVVEGRKYAIGMAPKIWRVPYTWMGSPFTKRDGDNLPMAATDSYYTIGNQGAAYFGPILESEKDRQLLSTESPQLTNVQSSGNNSFYRTTRPPEKIVLRHVVPQFNDLSTSDWNRAYSMTKKLLLTDFYFQRNFKMNPAVKAPIDNVIGVVQNILAGHNAFEGTPLPLSRGNMVNNGNIMARSPIVSYSMKLAQGDYTKCTPDSAFAWTKEVREALVGYMSNYTASSALYPVNLTVS